MLEAESFVLVLEDPDAPREQPFVHWLIWNIPGTAVGLPRGVPTEPRIKDGELKGAVQGRNDAGVFGYYGPKPPPGHGVHHYHFQLFALDKTLPMEPTTPLAELLNALKRDSIAKADLIGTYEMADGPQPPA
ncbi:MAG: YbhB/YbcL family Raf kinase inhibitor-like protein [Caulobacteraceae bacterium]